MKRGVFFIILLLAMSVSAQELGLLNLSSDTIPPTIEKLEVFIVDENINEVYWEVSDNVALNKFELFKDDVRIKVGSMGGVIQIHSYKDLNAFGDHEYRFVVYDAAGSRVEDIVSLNKTEEQEEIDEAIAMVPQEQIIVTPIKEPVPEPLPEPAPVLEEPAPRSFLIPILLLFIAAAIIWRFISPKPKTKSPRHRRNQELGMDHYVHQRRKRKT